MHREGIKVQLAEAYSLLKGALPDYAGQVALMEGSFIAGGAIPSLLLNEPVKDYDVWFRDLDSWETVSGMLKSYIKRSSRFAVTAIIGGVEFQLIKNRLGSPISTVETFDFLHTQCYYTPLGELFIKDEDAIRRRELRFMKGNLCHPTNTFQRVMKFTRRGWYIPQPSLIDLMLGLQDVPKETIAKDYAGSR